MNRAKSRCDSTDSKSKRSLAVKRGNSQQECFGSRSKKQSVHLESSCSDHHILCPCRIPRGLVSPFSRDENRDICDGAVAAEEKPLMMPLLTIRLPWTELSIHAPGYYMIPSQLHTDAGTYAETRSGRFMEAPGVLVEWSPGCTRPQPLRLTSRSGGRKADCDRRFPQDSDEVMH